MAAVCWQTGLAMTISTRHQYKYCSSSSMEVPWESDEAEDGLPMTLEGFEEGTRLVLLVNLAVSAAVAVRWTVGSEQSHASASVCSSQLWCGNTQFFRVPSVLPRHAKRTVSGRCLAMIVDTVVYLAEPSISSKPISSQLGSAGRAFPFIFTSSHSFRLHASTKNFDSTIV